MVEKRVNVIDNILAIFCKHRRQEQNKNSQKKKKNPAPIYPTILGTLLCNLSSGNNRRRRNRERNKNDAYNLSIII